MLIEFKELFSWHYCSFSSSWIDESTHWRVSINGYVKVQVSNNLLNVDLNKSCIFYVSRPPSCRRCLQSLCMKIAVFWLNFKEIRFYGSRHKHTLIMAWWRTGNKPSLTARFMGPTWGPSGADRTQVGPMLAPWTLLSLFLWSNNSLVFICIYASLGLDVLISNVLAQAQLSHCMNAQQRWSFLWRQTSFCHSNKARKEIPNSNTPTMNYFNYPP